MLQVSCAQLQPHDEQHRSIQPLLQQLTSPDTPPYAILGSEQWPQLAHLLPLLLCSCNQATAALAEQLLQHQLVPELLHCSPEPLAQLLTSLLAACCCSGAPLQQQPQTHATATVPTVQGTTTTYSFAVLQFMTSGLQKLGRQWHFLDADLADRLCAAVVAALLQPLRLLVCQQHPVVVAAAASAQQSWGSKGSSTQPVVVAKQQQQQVQQQLAVSLQLLQCDPMLCWWRRLNANSASSRPLKAAATQQGLPALLMQWADGLLEEQQQQPSGLCSSTPSDSTQHRNHAQASSSATPGAGGVEVLICTCVAAGSSAAAAACPTALCKCLAVHCLSALVGTRSGRQLLLQSDVEASARQPQPQQPEASTPPHASCSQQPESVAMQCLQQWAHHLYDAAPSDAAVAPTATKEHNQLAFQPCWGPVRPAAVTRCSEAAAGGQCSASVAGHGAAACCCDVVEGFEEGGGSHGAGGGAANVAARSAQPSPPTHDTVVQAAAATAAWAVRACKEQQPWFCKSEAVAPPTV